MLSLVVNVLTKAVGFYSWLARDKIADKFEAYEAREAEAKCCNKAQHRHFSIGEAEMRTDDCGRLCRKIMPCRWAGRSRCKAIRRMPGRCMRRQREDEDCGVQCEVEAMYGSKVDPHERRRRPPHNSQAEGRKNGDRRNPAAAPGPCGCGGPAGVQIRPEAKA